VASRVAAIWDRREVLDLLVRRDLKVKYSQSLLGYGWSLLEPLLLTFVYWFVFSFVLSTRAADYPLHLVCVLLPMLWVNSVVSESTRSLTNQSKLITSMNIPRELFPLTVVGGKLVEYVISIPVIILFAVIYHRGPRGPVEALGVLLAIGLEAVFLTGISLALSALNVMFRDVERLIRILLRALFYLSPVVYGLDRIVAHSSPSLLRLYELNPLVGMYTLQRNLWFAEVGIGPWVLTTSVVGSGLMLWFGWWVFHRLEPAILKEL
jgi:ABC-2 type transport system permease protein